MCDTFSHHHFVEGRFKGIRLKRSRRTTSPKMYSEVAYKALSGLKRHTWYEWGMYTDSYTFVSWPNHGFWITSIFNVKMYFLKFSDFDRSNLWWSVCLSSSGFYLLYFAAIFKPNIAIKCQVTPCIAGVNGFQSRYSLGELWNSHLDYSSGSTGLSAFVYLWGSQNSQDQTSGIHNIHVQGSDSRTISQALAFFSRFISWATPPDSLRP